MKRVIAVLLALTLISESGISAVFNTPAPALAKSSHPAFETEALTLMLVASLFAGLGLRPIDPAILAATQPIRAYASRKQRRSRTPFPIVDDNVALEASKTGTRFAMENNGLARHFTLKHKRREIGTVSLTWDNKTVAIDEIHLNRKKRQGVSDAVVKWVALHLQNDPRYFQVFTMNKNILKSLWRYFDHIQMREKGRFRPISFNHATQVTQKDMRLFRGHARLWAWAVLPLALGSAWALGYTAPLLLSTLVLSSFVYSGSQWTQADSVLDVLKRVGSIPEKFLTPNEIKLLFDSIEGRQSAEWNDQGWTWAYKGLLGKLKTYEELKTLQLQRDSALSHVDVYAISRFLKSGAIDFALHRAGIRKLGDFTHTTEGKLVAVGDMARARLQIVRQVISVFGLHLAGEQPADLSNYPMIMAPRPRLGDGQRASKEGLALYTVVIAAVEFLIYSQFHVPHFVLGLFFGVVAVAVAMTVLFPSTPIAITRHGKTVFDDGYIDLHLHGQVWVDIEEYVHRWSTLEPVFRAMHEHRDWEHNRIRALFITLMRWLEEAVAKGIAEVLFIPLTVLQMWSDRQLQKPWKEPVEGDTQALSIVQALKLYRRNPKALPFGLQPGAIPLIRAITQLEGAIPLLRQEQAGLAISQLERWVFDERSADIQKGRSLTGLLRPSRAHELERWLRVRKDFRKAYGVRIQALFPELNISTEDSGHGGYPFGGDSGTFWSGIPHWHSFYQTSVLSAA